MTEMVEDNISGVPPEDDIDGIPMDLSADTTLIGSPFPASSPPAQAQAPSSEVNNDVSAPTSPVPVLSTPKKRGSKAKKEEANDGDDEEDEVEETPKKKRTRGTPKSAAATPKDRQRKAPNAKVANARHIARSRDELSEHDKALIDMRDAGRSWADIRSEWRKLTGDKTASSTLPNRYSRLKSNFTVIREEDNALLLAAKVEVDDIFEAGKWQMVADAIEKNGGDKYRPDALKRQYKKLITEANVAPPEGVKDKDFEEEQEEDE